MTHSVVIVENESLVAQLLSEIIDGLGGYKVLYVASNGREMIEKFQVLKNIPEIIVLDVNMPVMDGFETAQWLYENHRNVAVLALSGDGREKTVLRILRSGAKGYLLKNIDIQELKVALDCIVAKGHYYPDWLTETVFSRVISNNKPETSITIGERQLEFLKLAASEYTYKEIADRMCLSPRTVEGYRDELFAEFGLKTRVGLVLYALKHDLLRMEEIKVL